jgi:hypothetical protein
MPKQHITLRVEVEYYVEEDYDRHEFKYPEIIESVVPVDIHTKDLSPEVQRAILDYVKHDDDAHIEFMWEVEALLGKKLKQ